MALGGGGRGLKVAIIALAIFILSVLLLVVLNSSGGSNAPDDCDPAGCAIAPFIDSDSTVSVSEDGNGGYGQSNPPENSQQNDQPQDDQPQNTPPQNNPPANAMDAFAQCLAQRGVTLYSKSGCPVCLSQEQKFGSSIRYVAKIDCDSQPQLCSQAGLKTAPTWVFPTGMRLEGAQELETLARYSGCQL